MVDEKLLKAIQEYKGPITKCRPGRVEGAADLNIWALNRSGGGAGVPDKDQWERKKAYFRGLRSKARKRLERQSKKVKRWARKRAKNPPMFEDGDTSGPPPWE